MATVNWHQGDMIPDIHAALSAHNEVRLENVGQVWEIGETLRIPGGKRLVFDSGLIMNTQAGKFRGTHDYMVLVEANSDPVQVIGNSCLLVMNKSDYASGALYPASQWRHGIALLGATDVSISDVTVKNAGGDAIYLGFSTGPTKEPCQRITVAGSTFEAAYRNGTSVVSAVDCEFNNCTFKNTVGTAPQVGVDVEPEWGQPCSGIVFRMCAMVNNKSSGAMVNLTKLSGNDAPVAVRFFGCHVAHGPNVYPGVNPYRFICNVNRSGGPRGLVEFDGCTAAQNYTDAISIAAVPCESYVVRFNDKVVFGNPDDALPETLVINGEVFNKQ